MTEAPSLVLKAFVVAAPESPYSPSVEYLVQSIRLAGYSASVVSLSGLLETLNEDSAQNESIGYLLLPETVLGPIGNIDDFLTDAASHAVYTLTGESDADGPLQSGATALYLNPAKIETQKWEAALKAVRGAPGFDLGGSKNLLDELLDALTQSGVAASVRTRVPASPTEYEDSRSFLRDGLVGAMAEGTPFLPWKIFTADPLALERWAIHAPDVMRWAFNNGYPEDVFWRTLLAASAPHVWFANTGQYKILSADPMEVVEGPVSPAPIHTVVQVADARNLPALLNLLATLNCVGPVEVYWPEKMEGSGCDVDVFLAEFDRGRSPEAPPSKSWRAAEGQLRNGTAAWMSPSLFGSAAPREETEDDLVVFLTDQLADMQAQTLGKTPQQQVAGNLAETDDYFQRVLALFDDPRLGIVFTPVPLGYEDTGDALAARIGLADGLAPVGGMFVARGRAVKPFHTVVARLPKAKVERLAPEEVDGLIARTAYASGYFGSMVQTLASAEAQGLMMESRIEKVSSHLYPHALEAVEMFRGLLESHPDKPNKASLFRR